MGTSVITLCTGPRDPSEMWRHHPDNHTTEERTELRSRPLIVQLKPDDGILGN